jgi:hypothetical protein
LRKIIFLLAFPLLVHVLTGCTTTIPLRADEIPAHPGVKIVELARPSTVVGVVLKDTTRIAPDSGKSGGADSTSDSHRIVRVDFAKKGGDVDLANEIVTGTTPEGRPFTSQFVDLKYIMVKETDIARKFVTPFDLSCDLHEVLDKPLKRVERGSSPCWDVIDFDKNGGRYDSGTDVILGVSENGTAVAVARRDVVYAAYNQLSLTKPTKAGLSLAVAAIMLNGFFHVISP